MNQFSVTIYKALIKQFPDWHNFNNPDKTFLELDIPTKNNAEIGGLVIQTTEENSIWVRTYHPYSAYSVETAQELITIIKGVLSDKILWVIGFMGKEWFETTLVSNTDHLKAEKGVTYKVLSWSGMLDKTFTGN